MTQKTASDTVTLGFKHPTMDDRLFRKARFRSALLAIELFPELNNEGLHLELMQFRKWPTDVQPTYQGLSTDQESPQAFWLTAQNQDLENLE